MVLMKSDQEGASVVVIGDGRLRAALPEIGIVAISAWDTRSSRRSAAESGADVFVGKKQSSKGLVEAICFASKGNTRGGS